MPTFRNSGCDSIKRPRNMVMLFNCNNVITSGSLSLAHRVGLFKTEFARSKLGSFLLNGAAVKICVVGHVFCVAIRSNDWRMLELRKLKF